jgi:hypothetical protein
LTIIARFAGAIVTVTAGTITTSSSADVYAVTRQIPT